MDNDTVKEVVEKATEFISTDKGKEVIETVKEKANSNFISDNFYIYFCRRCDKFGFRSGAPHRMALFLSRFCSKRLHLIQ